MIHPFTAVKKWHRKFQFHKEPMTLEKLQFRAYLQTEEHDEFQQAVYDGNKEEIVDALIDQIWIACGTLDLLGIDFDKAFKQVEQANMSKERGIKPGREQSGGFDVIKPKGWKGPDHSGNYGLLNDIFK
jgi:predicted HAD superfamily Cof-like phosphohydrolase